MTDETLMLTFNSLFRAFVFGPIPVAFVLLIVKTLFSMLTQAKPTMLISCLSNNVRRFAHTKIILVFEINKNYLDV